MTHPHPFHNPNLPIDQRVADLLGRMTLAEKLAQMSIFPGNIAEDVDSLLDETGRLDAPKALAAWPNGAGAISRLGLRRSPGDTARLYNDIQRLLIEQTRLGIPALFVDEALHGLMAQGSTSFPQAIALASAWDPDLMQEVFTAAAAEMRARGGNYALTPVLDLARDPRWGRTEETYGEDPHLTATLGVAAVRGLQGDGLPIAPDRVLATAKHFAVHGQPEAGCNGGPTNFALRDIREVFLQPFQAAVTKAGVQSVMASYNEIDGIPVHVNRWLLGDVLRGEWGFQGFVTSDGYGIHQLISEHHVAADTADAARQALLAGVDFELDDTFPTLLAQVQAGAVPEAAIDQAVSRVLRAKFLLGLFEQSYADPDHAERITNCQAHQELALRAAQRALVLLKNDGLLPLDAQHLRTVAVIGPNAADLHLGGYSVDPGRGVSVLDGLRARLAGAAQVLYAEGCRITEGVQGWQGWWNDAVTPANPAEDDARIAAAVEVARQADVVLLVLGENESTCREGWSAGHLGDRDTLDLPGRQDDLARAVLETGKPTVVLLFNGRPLSILELAERAPAILEGWYLGQETGTAVADVLFGDVNPGGKLPITFPRSVGQIPAFYNHKPSARRGYLFHDNAPLFPFGHGLSYTTFAYDNLHVTPQQIAPDGATVVSVDVTNTGQQAGDEVVQLYLRDQVSSATRPVMELKGFRRITLQPGETQIVRFTLTPEHLQFLDTRMQLTVEPGLFDVMVGGSSLQVQTVTLEVAPHSPR